MVNETGTPANTDASVLAQLELNKTKIDFLERLLTQQQLLIQSLERTVDVLNREVVGMKQQMVAGRNTQPNSSKNKGVSADSNNQILKKEAINENLNDSSSRNIVINEHENDYISKNVVVNENTNDQSVSNVAIMSWINDQNFKEVADILFQNAENLRVSKKYTSPISGSTEIYHKVIHKLPLASTEKIASRKNWKLSAEILYLYDHDRATGEELRKLVKLSTHGFPRHFQTLKRQGIVKRYKGYYYLSEKGRKLVEEE